MTIQFLGAAREVTGSKHLITTAYKTRILLDCGMYQGKGLETDRMNRELGFNPSDIDCLILSHAHIDHSGLIPYIYRQGFRGRVICTPQTRDLCTIMLADSAHIQKQDTEWFNKKMVKQNNRERATPLYSPDDAKHCMHLFRALEYGRDFKIDKHTTLRFTRSGHMLGAAIVNLTIEEPDGKTTKLAFTGDMGRPQNRLIRRDSAFPQCDYLITEATYGDRRHQPDNQAEEQLCRLIHETCVEKGGKLIIPSFSVGRTQELVFVLNNLYNHGLLSHKLKVYVDSPLAVNASRIFSDHLSEMNADVQRVMQNDTDPFGFPTLTYISKAEDSIRLNTDPDPAVIISSSGMLEAGRVKQHVAYHIEDPRCTVLIVGYCTPASLGARIQRPGLKEISIFGVVHPIRAQILKMDGFSGHADFEEMLQYYKCQNTDKVKGIFIVHGEYDAQKAFADKLQQAGYNNITIPEKGQTIEI